MRTATAPEVALALSGNAYCDYYVKLEVQNGSGTYIDVGSALGTRWIINAQWGEERDTPVSQATFTLVQQIGAASLAPLMATSALNVDDLLAYSPLLDIGRLVRASVATMPIGVALDVSKYRKFFDGRIDTVSSVDAQSGLGPITIICSDLGGWLMDVQIETADVQYGDAVTAGAFVIGSTYVIATVGSTNFIAIGASANTAGIVFTATGVGSGTGTANKSLETVMQEILTANIPAGDPAVTLVKASTSNFAVTDYTQGAATVLSALTDLALNSTGEDVRYRYDASHVSQLTWYNPDRSRVTVDATFGVNGYVLSNLSLALADIRNVIEMAYTDVTNGESGTVLSEDLTSVSKYRRRFNRIGEEPLAGTTVEAQRVVDAVANDLSGAPAEFSVQAPFCWFVQLYDRYTFTANNRQYTDNQTLSVGAFQHVIENGRGATTLTCTGRVLGAYAAWLARIAPDSAVERSLSVLRISSKESADGLTRDFTVLVGTRVTTLIVNYRTVAITTVGDWHDFSDGAALPVDAASPLFKAPSYRIVTFTLAQPTTGYAMAMRLTPLASGGQQGASALMTIDAAPPAINAVIHATKIGNLARLEIDIDFGPSDGPVSVAVVERVLGTPTTILTVAMSTPATIDWTGYVELDARPIPKTADSISWTVVITDVAGNAWTFGPTYALTSAVLLTATPVESAGSATVTVVVTDAGSYLDKTHVDTAVPPATGGPITAAMSWHVTRLGITTVKACTTVPAGSATSGTYTLVETLDPLHPIQLAGFAHYVDGDTECFGIWTFDSDKIATVINATVASANGVATVTVVWDSDALIGANCARYKVDGGAFIETVTISSAYLSQFTVTQTAAKQTVVVQAKNAVDAGATWGNQATVEVGVSDIAGLLVTVTQTASTGFSDPGAGVLPTVTLTLVVSDPSATLTGAAVVVPTINGISALYNNTLGAPATTFNATLGTTYTFTATLYKALGGGGFAKFAASQGTYAGVATFWCSSAFADMAADVIITIGNNQGDTDVTAKASLVVNTVENADSMKWKASTSSQPTKANTIASGTSVSTGPPFYVADLGVSLALGDTVYVTVVLYDYAGIVMDKSFEAKATRSNLSRSKTIQWAAAGNFHAYQVGQSGDAGITLALTASRSIDELFYLFTEPLNAVAMVALQQVDLTHSFILADGGTLTGVSADLWTQTNASVSTTDAVISVYAVAIGALVDDSSPIATLTGTHTGGWQTVSNNALSQSTTAKRLVANAALSTTLLTGPAGGTLYVKFRSFTATYLPSNLQATI